VTDVRSYQIAKIDEEKRLVFGLASVAATADGKLVEDLQGDEIDPSTLEDAMYGYVLNKRVGGTMHEEMGTAALVESFVATPEKLALLMKSLGLDLDVSGFKGTAAWVGFKVSDDATWKAIKDGTIKAFSIGGTARVEGEAA